MTTIEYTQAEIRKFKMVLPKKDNGRIKERLVPRDVEIDGEMFRTSNRFWNSFFARFGISDTVFRYFDHSEVFTRITERVDDDKSTVQLCIERDDDNKLLAISAGDAEIVKYGNAVSLLHDHKGKNIKYHNGMLTARFRPVSGATPYEICGEAFRNSTVIQIPIDGYGKPRMYLELIRQICENGAVAMAPAFRSAINTGDDPYVAISRTVESYDNDAGFAALQKRFESAQRSWASVREAGKLYTVLMSSKEGSKEIKQLVKVTGDLPSIYGVSNIDAVPDKRKAVLPTKARVYDLLNFASEIVTHKLGHGTHDLYDRDRLNGFIGTLVSDQYDLEGSADRASNFADFFTSKTVGPKKN